MQQLVSFFKSHFPLVLTLLFVEVDISIGGFRYDLDSWRALLRFFAHCDGFIVGVKRHLSLGKLRIRREDLAPRLTLIACCLLAMDPLCVAAYILLSLFAPKLVGRGDRGSLVCQLQCVLRSELES